MLQEIYRSRRLGRDDIMLRARGNVGMDRLTSVVRPPAQHQEDCINDDQRERAHQGPD